MVRYRLLAAGAVMAIVVAACSQGASPAPATQGVRRMRRGALKCAYSVGGWPRWRSASDFFSASRINDID